uniref:GRAM domain-containing protein n=1 Tax=Mola mola TaxID=94237 RepID=A0A3Q3W946_MOLML
KNGNNNEKNWGVFLALRTSKYLNVEGLKVQLAPPALPANNIRSTRLHTHNSLSKTNMQYHKLFKEVSRDESLRQSYTCALQRDILYQGKMFVSDNWICFHSKVFGRDTKISIPMLSVTFIKKTKTALLVPNALVIETTSYQHVFVSFLSRNTTYKFLKSLCIHLEPCNSSLTSSCENSFRMTCPPSLPLDFSDLDGVVQHRRQEMMESSSSGSQTPDYDKIAGVCPILIPLCTVYSWTQIQLFSTDPKCHGNSRHIFSDNVVSILVIVRRCRCLNVHPLLSFSLTLVLFHLFLLATNACFQVNFFGVQCCRNAVSHRDRIEINGEIYGELSTNLFKLEKVCPLSTHCTLKYT